MGNLSNLYISKSYQSLIHLGSDNTASATLVGLQDGLGNSIGISVNTSGSLSISGSFTSSLENGYTWVGDSNNKTTLVPTSSFGGGGSINTGSFATTGSNTFVGVQTITGSNGTLRYSGTNLADTSLASIHAKDENPWLERFYNDTFSPTNSVMSYFGWNDGRFVFHNDSTQSIGIQTNGYSGENGLLVYPNKVAFVNNIEVTGSLTASLANGYTWVGDSNNRTTLVPTSSFGGGGTIDTGSFATTGSNTFYGNQTISTNVPSKPTGLIINSGSATEWFLGIPTDTIQAQTGRLVLSSSYMPSWFNFNNDNGWVEWFAQTTNFNNAVNMRGRLEIRDTFMLDPNFRMVLDGKFSASLQDGYVWVGDASGYGIPIPTSSFAAGSTGSFATTGSNTFIGNQIISASLIVTDVIKGTGSLSLQPDSNDARVIGIYNTSATDTHITASGGNLFLGNDETYVLVTTYANQKQVTIRADEKVTISGSLDISGSLTSSLQEGYVFVGDSNGRTTTIPTSSFAGNFATTGSNAFNGDQEITGSFKVTYAGNTGNPTIEANSTQLTLTGPSANPLVVQNLSGDVYITAGGSTPFYDLRLAAGLIQLGGSGDYQSQNSLQTTKINGNLTIISGSGDLYVHGNKQFNVGAFQSGITQSGSANVSHSMQFEVTDISQGVSIASNSRITLANSGTYNIQFSAQFDRVTGSGNDTVYVWLKKNGVNYNSSAGALTLSGGANQAKAIAAWNYVVDTLNTDYWELCWQSTDSNIKLISFPASGNIPSIPSIILTVTQVR